MKATRRIATAFAIASALFAACNGKPWIQNNDSNAALKALGSTVPVPEYGHKFWQGQHDQNTDAWREAVKLCSESILANYPNCLPINEIVQADKEVAAHHAGALIARGYQYDALRHRWFNQQQMEALGCRYHPRFDLGSNQGRFDCPPYVSLPQGEK